MNVLGQIKEKITSYADVYLKLFKINFILRTSSVLSYLMLAMICMFLTFCILLFIGFGISELFVSLGFSGLAAHFMVVGIYLLLLLLLLACRKGVTRFFASHIIVVLSEGDEDESTAADKDDE